MVVGAGLVQFGHTFCPPLLPLGWLLMWMLHLPQETISGLCCKPWTWTSSWWIQWNHTSFMSAFPVVCVINRVLATVGGAGRGRPPLAISAQPFFFFIYFFFYCLFHNRGSIIAQYTCVIYIENDLVRLWIPGPRTSDPRSLALCFVGFPHSACHYYSQLFSTTQIGLARTLVINDLHVISSLTVDTN